MTADRLPCTTDVLLQDGGIPYPRGLVFRTGDEVGPIWGHLEICNFVSMGSLVVVDFLAGFVVKERDFARHVTGYDAIWNV